MIVLQFLYVTGNVNYLVNRNDDALDQIVVI